MSEPPVPLEYAQPRRARGRLRAILTPTPSVGWFFLGGPICAVMLSLMPHASMCDALSIGVTFCGPSLAVLDWAVLRRCCTGKQLWASRVGTLLLVVALSGLLFLDGSDRIFRRAFAIDPPGGVKDLAVTKRYAGGPGDIIVTMRFHADRATIDALVAAQGLVPDEEG